MSDAVITVDDLGKRYRIGVKRERPTRAIGRFRQAAVSPFNYILTRLRPPHESEIFWALRNVSFKVRRGEVLGVIGRNGAGKSTLLKILSRITDPTEGRAEVRGRINSLLEVGTGFHPELTGRENIYLNAAIHGLRRSDINRKLDSIVDFSEIERFIDTAVKYYSSGMYTRLAFAVAAHLDPDVLLVDEVLAVGDVSFQKKCLGKMDSAAHEGRTVIFVSHQMAAISALCRRLVLLDQGRVVADGPTEEVLPKYIASSGTFTGEKVWADQKSAPGDDVVRLRAVRVLCEERLTSDVRIDRDVGIEMDYDVLKAGVCMMSAICLKTPMGSAVLSSFNAPSACMNTDEWFMRPRPAGAYRSICRIPANFLNNGSFSATVVLISEGQHIHVQANDAIEFFVHETGAMRKEFQGNLLGVVRPRLIWNTEQVTANSGRTAH